MYFPPFLEQPFDTRSTLADDILSERRARLDAAAAKSDSSRKSPAPLLRTNRFGGISSAPSVVLSKYGNSAVAEARCKEYNR